MVRAQARALVGTYVALDVLATAAAWVAAYFLRFHSDLVGVYLPVSTMVPVFLGGVLRWAVVRGGRGPPA